MDPKVIPIDARVRVRRGIFAGETATVRALDPDKGWPRVQFDEGNEGWCTYNPLDLDVLPAEPFPVGSRVRVKDESDPLFGWTGTVSRYTPGGAVEVRLSSRPEAIGFLTPYAPDQLEAAPPVALDPREPEAVAMEAPKAPDRKDNVVVSVAMDASPLRAKLDRLKDFYSADHGAMAEGVAAFERALAGDTKAPDRAEAVAAIARGAALWQQRDRLREVMIGIQGHVVTVTASATPAGDAYTGKFLTALPEESVGFCLDVLVTARKRSPMEFGTVRAIGNGEIDP